MLKIILHEIIHYARCIQQEPDSEWTVERAKNIETMAEGLEAYLLGKKTNASETVIAELDPPNVD